MKSIDTFNRSEKLVVSNRKARHEYEIISAYEAGIVLQGTEVKSLRAGQSSLQDAHSKFLNKNSLELYLYGFHISPYEQGSYANHTPKRPRKLLLNHSELKRIKNVITEKKYVLIPLSVYFSGHIAKIELAVCRPKKKYDKREALKAKEQKREISRKMKTFKSPLHH
ncbi:MAG: SsrA-binding protein SmpB [Ignavibacteria bacterium]|jgi:SsrA-binding protein|nr:SsrA-binding protein SmpB [Ignavibacteria bacterium]